MHILHYYLGPHRQGGLNRYATDLAKAQTDAGNTVSVLFPDGGVLPRKTAAIRERYTKNGVRHYVLRGGPVVPLLEGIRTPEMILAHPAKLSEKEMLLFYEDAKPQIFHIHTWMGFPPELLDFLKNKGCRIVFTTHDYFGICPKVNLIDCQGKLCDGGNDELCSRCCASSPGARYLALRNSAILFSIKKFITPAVRLLSLLRKKKKTETTVTILPYGKLREYYHTLLRKCDMIHFNSAVTEHQYKCIFPDLEGQIVPIAHGKIQDHRRPKEISSDCIRLCFSGSSSPFKGLPMLLEVLSELSHQGVCNWHLDVWGCDGQSTSLVTYRGRYTDQGKVWANADLLIVPSICPETFGFVVPEALSYGVPVLVSELVGAQSLVSERMVFHGKDGLKDRLKAILQNPSVLAAEQKKIMVQTLPDMRKHASDMQNLYADFPQSCSDL